MPKRNTSSQGRIRRKTAQRAMGIIASAALISNILPFGGVSVHASEETVGACVHHAEHTEECGYGEDTPCAFLCRICPIEELIAALPEEITEDNSDVIRERLEEILGLYAELSEEEQESIDLSRCTELENALNGGGAPSPAANGDSVLTVFGTPLTNGYYTVSEDGSAVTYSESIPSDVPYLRYDKFFSGDEWTLTIYGDISLISGQVSALTVNGNLKVNSYNGSLTLTAESEAPALVINGGSLLLNGFWDFAVNSKAPLNIKLSAKSYSGNFTVNCGGDVTVSGDDVLFHSSATMTVISEGNASISGGSAEKQIPAFMFPSNLRVEAAGNINIEDKFPAGDYSAEASVISTGGGTVDLPEPPVSRKTTIDLTDSGIKSIVFDNFTYTVSYVNGDEPFQGGMTNLELTITGNSKNTAIDWQPAPESGKVILKNLYIDNSDTSSDFALHMSGYTDPSPTIRETEIGIEGNVELIHNKYAVCVYETNAILSGTGSFTASVKGNGSGNNSTVLCTNGNLGVDVKGDVEIRMEQSGATDTAKLFGISGGNVSIKGKNVKLAQTGAVPEYKNGETVNGVTVIAEETYTPIKLFISHGDPDFTDGTDKGDLNADGYHWNNDTKTLFLNEVTIDGTITLPDDNVTIETTGSCYVGGLSAGNNPIEAHLIFSGTGDLTVEEQINICGGDNIAITVKKDAHLTANGGINTGASGGVSSVITVYGALTSKGNSQDNAITAGKVIVGSGGVLDISGENGLSLRGMNQGGSTDFTGVFTVEKGGAFFADCDNFNVEVPAPGSGFPAGSNPENAFNIPENYLPIDCEVRTENGGIDFIRKSTGEVYTGPMAIHEYHDWPDHWNRKDETGHWEECLYEGCDHTRNYEPHSYNQNTWECTVCGAELNVILEGAQNLTYNGAEQRPNVTVEIDGTEIDPSRYDTVYANNINTGEASVTVTGGKAARGKGELIFNRTVTFQIGKAAPTVEWKSASQNLTYTGEEASITAPAVTLKNSEAYGGTFVYSYAEEGSAEYKPGLPVNAGSYTVKAEIGEQNNYTAANTADALKLVIGKASAPEAVNETKKYSNINGSKGAVTEDIAGKLPKDRGDTEYTVAYEDNMGILSEVAVDENGNLVYTVLGNKSVGDTAKITVTAEMRNYENALYNADIELVDKKLVEVKPGTSVSVIGSNILTYGQTLSSLKLENAVFIASGTETEVKGVLEWKNPSYVPKVSSRAAEWVFTPERDDEFETLTGMAAITVLKATPITEAPTVEPLVYNPETTLGSVDLKGGSAEWTVGGKEAAVEGEWSWKDASEVPSAGKSVYKIIFTPEDRENYNTAECDAEVSTAKAVPYIVTPPEAKGITYGDSLKDSLLEGGRANYSETSEISVPGSFSWKDGSVKPIAADSEKTEFDVVFTPADGINYSQREAKITLTVKKAEYPPNMPSSIMNVGEDKENVDNVELPENWQWEEEDKNKTLPYDTPTEAVAVYVGEDKENYENITVIVTITRSDCYHENTEIRNAVDATCREKGYSGDTYCLDCGALLSQGHETPATDHSGGTASCVSGKICEICGTEYTEKDEETHLHTEIRGRKNPFCTAEGYTGETYCTDCNTKISSGTTIPATGHNWAVTDEKEATAVSEGKRVYTCTVCGDTYTETTDRLAASSETADIGENANPIDDNNSDGGSEKEEPTITTEGTDSEEAGNPPTGQARERWYFLSAAAMMIVILALRLSALRKKNGEKGK